MELKKIILIIILSLIIIIVLHTLTKKGWECDEGGCEYVIGGKHNSKEECVNSCEKQNYNSSHERRILKSRRERLEEPKKRVSFKEDSNDNSDYET